MDIRFTVGLLLIAVGALMAMLGGVVAFGRPGDRPDLVLRVGCGGTGALGVLLALLGLRLRNRAVADSPELQRALEGRGQPTSRTGTAKPAFLVKKEPPTVPAPPDRPAAPPKPPRAAFAYWVIFGAFAVVVLGLLLGTIDFFQGGLKLEVVLLVAVLLGVLTFPLLSLRGRRRRR